MDTPRRVTPPPRMLSRRRQLQHDGSLSSHHNATTAGGRTGPAAAPQAAAQAIAQRCAACAREQVSNQAHSGSRTRVVSCMTQRPRLSMKSSTELGLYSGAAS